MSCNFHSLHWCGGSLQRDSLLCHCIIGHLPRIMGHLPGTMGHLPATMWHLPGKMWHLPGLMWQLPGTMGHLPCFMWHLSYTVCYLPATIGYDCKWMEINGNCWKCLDKVGKGCKWQERAGNGWKKEVFFWPEGKRKKLCESLTIFSTWNGSIKTQGQTTAAFHKQAFWVITFLSRIPPVLNWGDLKAGL